MRTEDGYIIYKCLNGDTGAFSLLVDRYKAGVYALAYSRLRNFHDAEDATQEVFIRAYENLHKLRRWESFASWLYRVTVNLCRRWTRMRARQPDGEFMADKPPEAFQDQAVSSYRAGLIYESLHEALESLPEDHRQVLTLHYLGGMTSAEIARFVGMAPATIRRRLIRARSMLKAEMLATMSAVFEEHKLQASFTLRVTEIVKHIRVKPLPRLADLPWGVSSGLMLSAVLLSLGIFAGVQELVIRYMDSAAPEASGSAGAGVIPVDIVEQKAMEREGDASMLNNRKMSIAGVLTAVIGILSGSLSAPAADAPGVAWEKTFGGSGYDHSYYVCQTTDGGYVMVGDTQSFGGAGLDIYLIKTDASGIMKWQRTFGYSNDDMGFSVKQTTDGGYIITGWTKDASGHYDVLLLRTDSSGNEMWKKTFGQSGGNDECYDVQQTEDGGYIITGCLTFSSGAGDALLIKTDKYGELDKTFGDLDGSATPPNNRLGWTKFGGDGFDRGRSVQQTGDGGYIIAGSTRSFGAGSDDVWLIKTDEKGDLDRTFGELDGYGEPKGWTTFGGSNKDSGESVCQTWDGGYIISGFTFSFGAGWQDGYVIKTLANGDLDAGFGGGDGWITFGGPFGGTGYDNSGKFAQQTTDGGYIIGGFFDQDFYLMKTDRFGNKEWEKMLGGPGREEGHFGLQAKDGGYVITGETNSFTGSVDVYLVKVSAENQPPVADAGGPYTGTEGSPVTLDASLSSDPDGDPLQYRWDFDSDGIWDTGWSSDPTANHTWYDDWNGLATVEVSDEKLTDVASASVTIQNVPPTVGFISAPLDPVQVDTTVDASASFTDPGALDAHTASWNWGDSTNSPGSITEANGSGTASGSHTYSTPGVYTLKVTVTDDDGGSGESPPFQYVVVYDPSAGFVTGGGWIDSPSGAYTPENTEDPDLTGKANFGFVSKYKKGADVPTGSTQFTFHVANLSFHSTEYDWLVVAGDKAKFKGWGNVNDEGDYQFMLTAIDGDDGVDRFRIRIWDADEVLYDNKHGSSDDSDDAQVIGGGSIVIHREKTIAAPSQAARARDTALLAAYPQPCNPDVWIPYRLSSDSQVVIRIYNEIGRLVRTLDLGHRASGFYVDKAEAAYWDGTNESGESVASGIYFYTFHAGEYAATRKMLILK